MPKKVPKSEKILGKPEDTRSFSKYFDGPPDNFIKANQATHKLDLTCNLFWLSHFFKFLCEGNI